MRSVLTRIRACPRALAILLAIAFVHGTAWAVVIAPLNGPDEVDHVAYVQHLAETGDGPQTETGGQPYSTELQALLGQANLGPMLGNLQARPTYDRIDDVTRGLDRLGSDQRSDGAGPVPVAKNPPLYYAYAAVAYRVSPDASLLDRLFVIRMATVLLFVVAVALAWALFGELFATPWLRTLATALVALQPKLASIAGVVNPDMLLVTLTIATTLAAVRIAKRGPSLGLLVAVSLCAGGAVMTHGRGFGAVPIALAGVAIGAWRFRASLRDLRRTALLAAAGGAAFVVPVVIAFLYTRGPTGAGAFGGEVAQAGQGGTNVKQFLANVWQFYFPRLPFMEPRLGPDYGYRQMYVETYFGAIGALEVNVRPAIYGWIQLAAGVGLIALVAAVARRWERVLACWPQIVVMAVSFVGLMGLLHLTAYRDLARGSADPLITGRYLLPAVAAYAGTIAFVVASLPRRVGALVAGVLLGGNVLLAVGLLGVGLQRFHG